LRRYLGFWPSHKVARERDPTAHPYPGYTSTRILGINDDIWFTRAVIAILLFANDTAPAMEYLIRQRHRTDDGVSYSPTAIDKIAQGCAPPKAVRYPGEPATLFEKPEEVE
jgi:hypothetical protein